MKISVFLVCKYKDKVLLLKRGKKSNNPGQWNFPGGTVEKKDNAKGTIIKEMREEANLKLKKKDLKFLDQFHMKNKIVVFFMANFDEKPKIKINYESSRFKWVRWNNLPRNLHLPTRILVQFKKPAAMYERASLNETIKSMVENHL
jgi:ADP-ribose pyrophosphatase YjhB (NUDIX family)